MVDIHTERLSEFAARCLAPQNLAEGTRQINDIVKKCRWKVHVMGITLLAVAILGTIFLLSGFFVFIEDVFTSHSKPFSVLTSELLCAASAFLIACGIYGRGGIQTRTRFFVDRPYDIELPSSIENLLGELASGRLEAVLPVPEYGAASTTALRASDGKRYDIVLDRSVFKNRYAPILLSCDTWHYSSVRVYKIDPNRPINVVLGATEKVTQNAPLLLAPAPLPVIPHWITKIPKNCFEDWFEFVRKVQAEKSKKPGRAGRPWDREKEIKHHIILKAAHEFATNKARRGEEVSQKEMVSACEEALRKAMADGLITFLSLSGGDRKDSIDWVDKVVGNTDSHSYAWIRGTVDRFTPGE